MHEAAGNQGFVAQSLQSIQDQLANPTQDLTHAIALGVGSTDPAEIQKGKDRIAAHVATALSQTQQEGSHGDKHYVSRFDPVGLFQSALSRIFNEVPGLQGYGNMNPIWVLTIIEEIAEWVKKFFAQVHQDQAGNKQPVWAAIVTELLRLGTFDDRSPYPTGTPVSVPLPENCTVAVLADWGGDNDAAKSIAAVVRKQKPDLAIHLGDIYYGGTELECRLFLDNWPMRQDFSDPNSPLLAKGSFALNGNHEMYSGGEYYFKTILPAFAQSQPFFCIENQYWRLIGLDTAYNAGVETGYNNARLKPTSPADPMAAQWNWLIDTLRGPKKANILLTHHQPVSAHQAEFSASEPLRKDFQELLATDGVGPDAIYGWFFGHEHRCAVYRDSALEFNARLIGNGCIPHEVQQEKEADPGCTPVDFFNKKETSPGSGVAVSSFAKLTFMGPQLLIEYIDETFMTFGVELWDATKGRLEGDPDNKFHEYDGITQQAPAILDSTGVSG